MQYPQLSFPNTVRTARSRRTYSWSDPAQVEANQRGSITQEQRILLDKGPGCFSTLVTVLFIYSIVMALLLIGTLIYYMFFAGKPIVWRNDASAILLMFFVIPLILGWLSSALQRAHTAHFTRSTDALLVERVQGEVIWEGGHYLARTPDFRLTTTSKSPSLPLPGPYHFFYVTGKNILLSAEPIHGYTGMFAQPGTLAATGLAGDEQARQALQMALCSTLRFGIPELDVNRLGMLSDAQRRRENTAIFLSNVVCFIVFVLCGVALILSIVGPLNGWITYDRGTGLIGLFQEFGFIWLVLVAIMLVCLYGLAVTSWKHYAVLEHETVQNIEGTLQTRIVSGAQDSNDSYYYDIGQLSFGVSESAYKAVIGGILYRVYYLASSKDLVSIEVLEAPPR